MSSSHSMEILETKQIKPVMLFQRKEGKLGQNNLRGNKLHQLLIPHIFNSMHVAVSKCLGSIYRKIKIWTNEASGPLEASGEDFVRIRWGKKLNMFYKNFPCANNLVPDMWSSCGWRLVNHQPCLGGKPKAALRVGFHFLYPESKQGLQVGDVGFDGKHDPFG